MKTRILLLVAGATLMQAQKIDVKLGLWEVTTSTETSGMPSMPGVDLSSVPPEQRARIEAMMKSKMGKGAPQSRTSRDCITPEKLDKLFDTANQPDTTCKRTIVSTTATSQEVKIECTGRMKMTGEGKFTATSRENVSGTIKLTAGDPPNQMTINTTMTSKWLGAACGDVK